MKKMNLNFLGLKGKMVLPLFLLVGLFMFSASSVSAQYVSVNEGSKIVENHLGELPQRTASLRSSNNVVNQQIIDESINELRHAFASLIIRDLREGKSVSDAIEATAQVALNRIPAGITGFSGYVEDVKQEYIELLKK